MRMAQDMIRPLKVVVMLCNLLTLADSNFACSFLPLENFGLFLLVLEFNVYKCRMCDVFLMLATVTA